MEVQTGETGKGDDLAELGRLFGAMVRRVLAQGQVHSVVVVPVAKLTQQALGVPFVQHDQEVETLAAESANHPLREPRGGVPGEGVHNLLGEPLGRGVRGHVGED